MADVFEILARHNGKRSKVALTTKADRRYNIREVDICHRGWYRKGKHEKYEECRLIRAAAARRGAGKCPTRIMMLRQRDAVDTLPQLKCTHAKSCRRATRQAWQCLSRYPPPRWRGFPWKSVTNGVGPRRRAPESLRRRTARAVRTSYRRAVARDMQPVTGEPLV